MKTVRSIIWLFSSVIASVLLLILAAPTIASTNFGKELLLSLANQYVNGTLEIEKMNLRWGSGQEIEGFIYKDAKGNLTAKFDQLLTEASLWQLINQKVSIGHFELRDFSAALKTEDHVITLTDVNVDSQLFSPGKPLSIKATGKTTQDKLEGKFDIEAVLPMSQVHNWDQANSEVQKFLSVEGTKNASLNGTVVNFPLAFLDELLTAPIIDILGDRLNLQIAKEASSQQFLFSMKISTPTLEGNIKGKIENNVLLLQESAPFRWTVSPALLEEYISESDSIEHPFIITMNLQDLFIPLEGNKPSQATLISHFPLPFKNQTFGKEADLYLKLSNKTEHGLDVEANVKTDKISISPILFTLDSKKAIVHITAPSLSPLLGGSSQLDAEVNLENPTQFKTNIKSPNLIVNLQGQYSKSSDLNFTKPIKIDYRLTEEVLKLWETPFHLKDPSWINIEVNPFSINLRKIDLKKFILKGTSTISEATLSSDNYQGQTSFNKLFTHWELNGSLNQLRLETEGFVITNEQSKNSHLAGKVIIHDWLNENGTVDVEHSKLEISGSLYGMPMGVLSSFLKQKDLSSVLGPLVDIQIKSYYDQTATSVGFCDIDVDTEQFHTTARLRIEKDIITFQPGKIALEMRWIVTPEVFKKLQSQFPDIINKDTTLTDTMTLSGVISNLSLPIKDFKKGLIQGHFTTNAIQFKEKDGTHLDPLFLTFDLNSKNLEEKTSLKLTLLSKAQPDLFGMNAVLTKFADLSINCDIKDLPTNWTRTFLFLDPNHQRAINNYVGNKLNLHFDCQLKSNNGNLSANFESPRSRGTIHAKLDKGIIKLLKPLDIELTATSELADKEAPILSQLLGSDEPFKLTIETADFELPITPFDLNKVKVGKGTLRLGKVHFRNQGEIKNLLGMLKPLPGDLVTVWFTPIYFSLSNGQFLLKRADLLVGNQYSLAAWGNLELETKNMHMTLGLSAQALNYAFGINNLDSSYMLRVPVTGQQGKISVDYTRTAARISALVAQTRAGLEGKLIGTLLEIASGDMSDNGSTPPPTTHPLPWADQFADNSNNKKKSSKVKPIDDTKAIIEEVGKGASHLLNKILR